MFRPLLATVLMLATVTGLADESSTVAADAATPTSSAGPAVPVADPRTVVASRPTRFTGPPPTAVDPTTAPDDGRAPAQFETNARWEIAGYNNEEIIYIILITNHDNRVLRCSTLLKGYYFEKGEKRTVSDRQISTVLPNQQVQAGNWLGMDKDSGATYDTKCRAM